jgi:uncharacterized membrane protein HdeD (DUF308 family)
MTVGILWLLLGVFALCASVLTSYVGVIFIAVMLLIVGGLELVSAFRMHRDGPFLVYLLAGLLAIVVGALFLYRPLASLGALTLLVAGYLFASGLFRGISAVFDRYPRWGWDFAYGIVAILLGAYIVESWPLSRYWVLGTVIGIEIIARGIAMIAASWVVRDIEHAGRHGEFAAV